MNTYTQNQQQFIDAVEEGRNVYLSGKAGTGKSFVVREVMRRLQDSGKKVAAVAPTGIAANNIGGQTIHSLFQISPYGVVSFKECNFLPSEKRRLLEAVNVVVIDEISMLRPDVLDAIHWTMTKNGINGGLTTKQVIFVGDMKQLPVILDDNTRSVLYQTYKGDEFFNASVYEKLNVVDIELDEVLRQTNSEFVHALNIIRDGGKSEYFRQFVAKDADGIILAPHNATVKYYNEKGLREVEAEEIVFDAVITGNVKADEFNLESQIRVKDGCNIMYLANSKNNPLRNGTLGTFVQNESNYFIRVEGVEYALEPMLFVKKAYVYNSASDKLEMTELGSIHQYPIKLAYALSIHKSQGLTFDKVTIDLSLPCFQKGQLYVALSRVRGPEGLRILVKK